MTNKHLLLTLFCAATCLAPCLAQRNPIKVPPRGPDPQAAAPPREVVQSEFDRFCARLADLAAAGQQSETVLANLGDDFFGPDGDPEGLMRRGARSLRGAELEALARVAEQWIGPSELGAKIGHDLALQLQIREVGRSAIEPVTRAVAVLLGEAAPATLLDLARSKRSKVRAAAMDQLVERVTDLDFQSVLRFANDRSLDARRNGVRLLSAMGTDDARVQLVDMLSADHSRDLSICAAACEALIREGEIAAPLLLEVLEGPPLDHAWTYSAFALAQMEADTGARLLLPKHAKVLERQLRSTDAVSRSLAAVPLARLHWRGAVEGATPERAAAVVAALLDVASPQGYVPNMAMLQDPTDEALELLSGREAPDTRADWRAWWRGVSGAFTPMRQNLTVAVDAVGRAQLRLRRGAAEVRLYGEDLANLVDGKQGRDLLLEAGQMAALLDSLRQGGFQTDQLPEYTGPLAKVRNLELLVDGAGHRVAAPADGAPWFDNLEAIIDEVVEGERWQFYRHPQDEPDFDAFWRAERRWLKEHPEPEARDGRLADRVLKVWPALDDPRRRNEAVQILLSLAAEGVVDEARGQKLVACVRGEEKVGEMGLRLLEMAMSAPGDAVWREALDLVDEQLEKGLVGDDAAERAGVVSNIFGLMGPERVLAAVEDPRKRVRLGAIDEVVALRLRDAGPALMRTVTTADGEVRRAAVFALGMLRQEQARDQIIELANTEDCPPYLRQECMLALGRIGGPGVARLLRSVLAAQDPDLVESAVRGLGEMRDLEASMVLADLYAARHDDRIGNLTRLQLLEHGALRSLPALRFELERMTSPEGRRALLMLLGEMQDPEAVGSLIPLLAEEGGTSQARLVAVLEDATGLDLAPVNDRLRAMEGWHRTARNESQGAWLVAALDGANVTHTLTVEQLLDSADLGAVGELARLLETLEIPRLRVLTAAVLRNLTQLDFGLVTRATPASRLGELARRYRSVMDAQRAAAGKK